MHGLVSFLSRIQFSVSMNEHVVPSETFKNESVTSIIPRHDIMLASQILLWMLQPSSWDHKVKFADSYFDTIGLEKPTNKQAEKLCPPSGQGGFPLLSYFDCLDPRGHPVLKLPPLHCFNFVNCYLASKIILPAHKFRVYQVSSLNPHHSFWA